METVIGEMGAYWVDFYKLKAQLIEKNYTVFRQVGGKKIL